MKIAHTIPILRIFDVEKAKAFYVDWLGFKVDWEHTFEPNTPVYMRVSMDSLVLHLSEHHGDACPGANIFIECEQIEEYCELLKTKNYKYYRPSVEKTFYNTLEMSVTDPFGNKLSFNQELSHE